ncbi:AEC family transporter [Thiorhodospira sibirica]|uniref:AEC family transporter n=1 Tax=Thiorhodospira sibirica TaxID=154347 RepID=UPI00022C0453|nr:AEC family transporter [Thiorhodospira sibirica]
MLSIISQMGALILCGWIWRTLKPGGLDADTTRQVLTTLVYFLLLPALVLVVLWQAPLDGQSWRIAVVAGLSVVLAMLLAWGSCRFCKAQRRVTGTVILAAAFPNATYLGLPLLESLFGDLGRFVAIQYDLFACTPILLTVGILVASRMGDGAAQVNPLTTLLRVPSLWAAALGVTLNLSGVPLLPWFESWLTMLGNGVIPLMLFSLGLALVWRTWRMEYLRFLLPVVLIQLAIQPLFAWFAAHFLGLEGEVLIAVVLEAAMPAMVLGLVLCDRYRLDSALYAAAVTLTTLLAFVTLPLTYRLASLF